MVARRKPEPEVAKQQRCMADKLAAVTRAADELRAAEGDLERARKRFRQALREAHEAGAPHSMLGRLLGLSRQRIAQIIEKN
jgi:hypothetical protein